MSADGTAVEEPLSPSVLARRARPYLPALLMVLGIALAAYGQYELIQTRDASIDGALPYFGVGAVLFVAGLWLARRHQASYFPGVKSGPGDQASPFPLPFRDPQGIGLALGIAGLYGGIVFNGENTFTLGGVAVWFLGIAGFLWGFWKFGGNGEQRVEPKEGLRSWLPGGALPHRPPVRDHASVCRPDVALPVPGDQAQPGAGLSSLRAFPWSGGLYVLLLPSHADSGGVTASAQP